MDWFGGILKCYAGMPTIGSIPLKQWDVSFAEAQRIVDAHPSDGAFHWMYYPHPTVLTAE